jgi:hypothetical protein
MGNQEHILILQSKRKTRIQCLKIRYKTGSDLHYISKKQNKAMMKTTKKEFHISEITYSLIDFININPNPIQRVK